jgi:hypothetical protein
MILLKAERPSVVMSMGMPERPSGRGAGWSHPAALAPTVPGFRLTGRAHRPQITGGIHG